MIFKNKSLAFKQSFLIVSCVLLIFWGIFSFVGFKFRGIMLSDARNAAQHLGESTANRLEQTFIEGMRVVKQLAIQLENGKYTDEELKNLMVMTLQSLKDRPEIYGSSIAFAPYEFDKSKKYYMPYVCWQNNKVAYMRLGGAKYEYFYHSWFDLPRMTGKAFWSEPYYDEGGGNILMTTYSIPFYSVKNGKKHFRGVVTIDLSLKWIQRIVNSIKVADTGYVTIVSRMGNFISHPKADYIMNRTIFSIGRELKDETMYDIGRSMAKGESGFRRHKRASGTEKPSWIYFTPLKTTDWSVAIVMPEDELYASLYKTQRQVLMLGALGALLVLLAIVFITRKITTPLKELSDAARQIGQGNLDVPIPQIKSGDEIAMLGSSFAKMQTELQDYIKNLAETTAAKEKIENELTIARDIQLSIIPKFFPPFPHRRELSVFAMLESAKAVGGDLYDFFFLDEKHLFFAVGDVSGKGIPASLFMAVTQTIFRATAPNARDVVRIINAANKNLAKDNEMMMFVTYFVGILNVDTGEVTFTNAGHNPPFIMRSKEKKLEKLSTLHGPPLAIMDDHEYGSAEFKLEPGDGIVLYTDGVTEAMNEIYEEFSESRLTECLETQFNKKSKETCLCILKAVKAFAGNHEQSDDITILTLRYYGNSPHDDA